MIIMAELLLVLVIVLLAAIVLILFRKLIAMQKEFSELLFAKQSQSVKYGKMTEQWIPFVKDFPFNPSDFRFLGSPVDGIVFDESKIVFCEFKTADSVLSEKQKRIRDLVKGKNVEWMQFNLKNS